MPLDFSHLVGHASALATLSRALSAGRAHAFLLHGPRHVGKTTVAEAAAAGLVGCAIADLGRHADVFRLRPPVDEKTGEEKVIGVDDVERFVASLAQSSVGGVKVGIVESAERLTVASQNALLKTVEEPRGKTVLFFVTDDPERLLSTLRSRTVPIAFGLVDGQRPGVTVRLRDADAKAADDARNAAVQALMTGPTSSRLRAAAAMAKGDDAASRDELVETAVRVAQFLHTTLNEKCGTMSPEQRTRLAAAATLANDAPAALRDYANPALIFEQIILALP